MGTPAKFDFRQHFSRSPDILGGETVFKGTRIPLSTILGSLASGDTPEILFRSFPTLTQDHMRAAIAFAAASACEDLPFLDAPAVA